MVYKTLITTNQLSNFLSNAKDRCTYRAEDSNKPNGRMIGTYMEGPFKYTSTPGTYDKYRCQENIESNGRLVWSSMHVGIVADESYRTLEGERIIAHVLKAASKDCPKGMPFRRGPDRMLYGEYEYRDSCKGDMLNFRGEETVKYKEELVYINSYSGRSGYNY
ncbi:MAG: DUF5680 domain-containing protein [Candidatus Micrarchaeaceae archaeon]